VLPAVEEPLEQMYASRGGQLRRGLGRQQGKFITVISQHQS